jgi:hypothetical protein
MDHNAGLSTMVVDMRAGDTLSLAGAIVEVVHKSGRQARLRVTAPRDLPIQKNTHPHENEGADFRYKHGLIKPA